MTHFLVLVLQTCHPSQDVNDTIAVAGLYRGCFLDNDSLYTDDQQQVFGPVQVSNRPSFRRWVSGFKRLEEHLGNIEGAFREYPGSIP
jgi:hypothetical protein